MQSRSPVVRQICSSHEIDKLEAEMTQYKQQDEDVLSYALFPQVATDFFKYREAQQTKVDAKSCRYKERSISGIKQRYRPVRLFDGSVLQKGN